MENRRFHETLRSYLDRLLTIHSTIGAPPALNAAVYETTATRIYSRIDCPREL